MTAYRPPPRPSGHAPAASRHGLRRPTPAARPPGFRQESINVMRRQSARAGFRRVGRIAHRRYPAGAAHLQRRLNRGDTALEGGANQTSFSPFTRRGLPSNGSPPLHVAPSSFPCTESPAKANGGASHGICPCRSPRRPAAGGHGHRPPDARGPGHGHPRTGGCHLPRQARRPRDGQPRRPHRRLPVRDVPPDGRRGPPPGRRSITPRSAQAGPAWPGPGSGPWSASVWTAASPTGRRCAGRRRRGPDRGTARGPPWTGASRQPTPASGSGPSTRQRNDGDTLDELQGNFRVKN